MGRTVEAEIIKAIRRGADEAARIAFRASVGTDLAAVERLTVLLARAVRLPAGAVLCGPARLVWGNPFRTDYAWRCGVCPWTGSNYITKRTADQAARRHSTDDHGGAVPVQSAT